MFASILPGIRELRVPLTAGLLWLFFLWILFFDALTSTTANISPFMKANLVLVDYFGVPAVLAILVFTAFLTGILSSVLVQGLGFLIKTYFAPFSYNKRKIWFLFRKIGRLVNFPISKATTNRLLELARRTTLGFVKNPSYESNEYSLARYALYIEPAIEKRHSPKGIYQGVVLDWKIAPDSKIIDASGGAGELQSLQQHNFLEYGFDKIVFNFKTSIPQTARRLYLKNKDFWDEYDKASIEALFRFSISFPITSILVALLLRFTNEDIVTRSIGFAVIAFVFLSFLWSSLVKEKEANDLILNLVADGEISSPVIEELNALANISNPV